MHQTWPRSMKRLRQRLALVLTGPPAFAFVPALCLAAFWFGGEGALVVLAGLLPVLYLVGGGIHTRSPFSAELSTGILPRKAFEEMTEETFQKAQENGTHAATLFVAIEDFDQVAERFGQAAADTVSQRVGDRILAALRADDRVGQFGDARFAICTAPVRHLDLELCIQLAGRVQSAVEESVSVDGTGIYISASVGFCQHSRAPGKTAADWLDAAAIALREARQRGPSAIRAFSEQMRRASKATAELREDVVKALEGGQIQPWFQPQISTDTGRITGFEALARWSHPNRGMISPAEFLPVVEQAGQLERLAEVMMYHSFAALKAWDGAGAEVPQVGVNFAGSELNNPKLVDKIQWELDRFELTPARLAVEVLETVVATAPDDMITRNINALGKLGCRIDLDDFGTGHASIASIRRFSVSRIKIDRSFVMKADRDPEQQRMISAILTMAERLGVETLAEGVETVGEHVLLAQLGCDHVQGFGIARPMPFEKTLDWIDRHNAKLADMPHIMKNNSH
ncbi:bifunctional diguanylate cyclase/phosphodiesterase [Sulfitobacter sp. M57]|uniref:putative bifunctional diguanylate cyclase/phosphodiesterase n=1 Tax=unclassified Sulfitobacter TaxID=196795 RepID=UPI0023E24BAA|nr:MULTISPECIES: bifunctional diguanylate cyclase/phosphodiesterase [unclassified Sulfitobacter]MDF3414440.1 bifunctional diguanylate cyclase/phosphodiesterase [Sulfitobacter sp. KE5]MDF3421921.1 bifunctional diguanylate cyclase/phosphodiesterase [Sulfitobacter sp. KE43]MDF3432986.1 bifunctional diguanylate cyclase/phosphodiesterase [Sulfitobacter sp. KE42]MDF3458626.1 bifunctional diguanylate cyclase/phosphodiesterase [Sulfitobacter sp. S74]MDF3462526.1 bifunctional diguanylate cyclase/phosph